MTDTSNVATLTGNMTGYGLLSGSETFILSGTDNTVLCNGADETINVASDGANLLDLNNSGFTGGVTDQIDLGTTSGNSVLDSNALYGSTLSISASGGPNTINLVNHGGQTAVTLGYTGDVASQQALGLINRVTLNGDATNAVTTLAGGYARVAIGTAGDGYAGYASAVSLYGMDNVLTGGDENFTLTTTDGRSNSIELGNGNDTLSLTGGYTMVSLGNGNDAVTLSGGGYQMNFGTGNNDLSVVSGGGQFSFAAGGAGAADQISLDHGFSKVTGGDENFAITGAAGATLHARLGNGNNSVNMGAGHVLMVFGSDLANSGSNSFTSAAGAQHLTFLGGIDQITLGEPHPARGNDTVRLRGTMLGTTLTAYGAWNTVTLTNDANAVINDLGANGAMQFTLDGDKTGGFGTIVINGLANDTLAHINLVDASAYTITPDDTPAGGITLNFDHGSIDLVGLQSVPNNLIS